MGHRESGWAATIALLLGGLYLATLLPGPGYQGDTAQFQFVGAVLGTPHPPGYPTYVVLNHLFTHWFPFGELAWRANLLSALFSLLACVLIFATQRRLGIDSFSACVATLAFATWPTVWSVSIVAEVYSLQLLFLALVFYAFSRWGRERDQIWLYAGIFAYALSFGNHLTSLVLLPALVVLVLSTEPGLFRNARVIAFAASAVVLGAAQYAYVFWRTADPATPYLVMEAHDLTSFLWGVSGGDFKGRMFAFSLDELATSRIPAFASAWIGELHMWLIPIAVGLWTLRPRRIAVFLVLACLGNVLWALEYRIPDIRLYFGFAYVPLAILLGSGIHAGRERMRGAWIRTSVVALLLVSGFAGYLRIRDTVHGSPVTRVVPAVERAIARLGANALILAPSYDVTELYLYWLIGHGMGVDRNTYVVPPIHFDGHRVVAYLREARPYELPWQRISVPPGLRVYGSRPSQREVLERLGMRVRPIARGFFEVLPPKTPVGIDERAPRGQDR